MAEGTFCFQFRWRPCPCQVVLALAYEPVGPPYHRVGYLTFTRFRGRDDKEARWETYRMDRQRHHHGRLIVERGWR
jgi:hypothetical protein